MLRRFRPALLAAAICGAQEFAPVVTVETARVQFHTAPLRSGGDAAEQTRQALDYLRGQLSDGELVKLRAFVKDAADAAAVRAAIWRRLGGKHPPALTLIEVGDLPRPGARLALEAVSVSPRVVNPGGLLFISGQAASASREKPVPVNELARRSLDQLRLAVAGGGAAPADLVRVTAYVSSLENFPEVRSLVEAFLGPASAPLAFVQIHRQPSRPVVEIEAIARLKPAPQAAKVEWLNPAGLAASTNYTQAIAVRSRRLAMSGAFLATTTSPGAMETQTHEAFRRLAAALDAAGAAVGQVVFSQVFPVSDEAAALVRKVRAEYYDRSRPPASTMLPFQGVATSGGFFAVETIAPLPDP